VTIACRIIAVLLGVIYAFGGVKKLVQSRDQLRPPPGSSRVPVGVKSKEVAVVEGGVPDVCT